MHFTFHLTTGCNMKCSYCYSPSTGRVDMTPETAIKAVDFAARVGSTNTGIIFFGGEPLLVKDTIKLIRQRCREREKEKGSPFHYKITTNGLLLDEEFLEYATSENIMISLSVDGTGEAHNTHRKGYSGTDTFEAVSAKIPMLLKHQPYANFMMVVSPETVKYYYDSVKYLLDRGCRYVIASLNYAGAWTDALIKELKKQYQKIAQLYKKLTLEERKFYFSPFEVKFSSHIKGDYKKCEQCHLGMRQVSIAPDGGIYPCVQFVKDGVSNREFMIGDIHNGIDEEKRSLLYMHSRQTDEPCSRCALNNRCNNSCSCLNWQTTGSIGKIPPILCEHERVIIPIVDKLGEELYKKRSGMFIQKHYNAIYPVLSLIDDVGCI